MSSLQTTVIRFEANQAERRWREHYQHCASCGRAVRTRQPGDACATGAAAREYHRAMARELAAARKLDKLPSPDQARLF